MTVAVVLLNRDLRVHDHPALAAATRSANGVVPLFVVDERLLATGFASPNRAAFLVDSLIDLRAGLQARGGDLVVRRGDPVEQAIAVARQVGAGVIHASADVTAYARRREERLIAGARAAGCQVRLHPGVTVVPADELMTGAGSHYRVFTPYWRAWSAHPRRAVDPPPRRVRLPSIDPGALPAREELAAGATSPELPMGGETVGRKLLTGWARSRLATYEDDHDDLARDRTSHLSPHLHFGTVSPLELVERVVGREGGAPFVRQLCWRDFHHQTTFHHPAIARADLRPRGRSWADDPDAFAAWTAGRTGLPIVDAAMRQLRQEGWMHNRARLLVASFLTKHLRIDWRLGAAHFLAWLVDGDIADNSANWQWAAGTGTDTRPNRILNPLRQARRFDPQGEYVRRHVPELAALEGAVVHEPWRLADRDHLDYPDPIVDHAAAADRFRASA
jgi:deoxyribodipyrimidine photo-lyase